MATESPGISPELAESVLTRALRNGGDYAEVFAEDRSSLSVRMDDGRLEEVSSGVDRGASIRLVKGPTTSFGYVDSLDGDAILALADRLSARARRHSAGRPRPGWRRRRGSPRSRTRSWGLSPGGSKHLGRRRWRLPPGVRRPSAPKARSGLPRRPRRSLPRCAKRA